MKSCEGCVHNDKEIAINEAKKKAKEHQCQYVVYYEAGQWHWLKRDAAAGIPYNMVFSHYAP